MSDIWAFWRHILDRVDKCILQNYIYISTEIWLQQGFALPVIESSQVARRSTTLPSSLYEFCPLSGAVAGPSFTGERQLPVCLGSSSPRVRKMANVVLEFTASAGDSEPQNRPVLIIGQQAALQQVNWNQIKGKLEPVVSKEVTEL